MRISEAKECIKELYLNTRTVTALISERGVGKTSAYKQCADELEIGYIDLYAAALEGPDFMGLPAKDLEKGITRYLAPQFLPTKAAIENGLYPEKGLLVLEEINRVPSDTISVLYPLLLESKINGHDLGEGWKIGVTMNPDTMSYLVNALDDAMLDRFISISVDPFIDDYIAYSRENSGNEQVMNFLIAHPDMLLVTNKGNQSSSMKKTPTPRGWTKVQEIMNTCQLKENLLTELIAGIVGPIAAATFVGFMKNSSMEIPSTSMMVTDYKVEQAKVRALVEAKEVSILSKVMEKLMDKLEATEPMVGEIDLFLKDLPDELRLLFYKILSRDRRDLLEFYSDKSSEFEAISDHIMDMMLS